MSAKANHREIIAFLREVGAESVRIEHGGKHPRVVFVWQGRERYKALSGTPSDRHAVDAAIRELRQALGLVKRARTVGERRARKPRPLKDAPAPCPAITVLPDHRDDLLMAKYRGMSNAELAWAALQACGALVREHVQQQGAP